MTDVVLKRRVRNTDPTQPISPEVPVVDIDMLNILLQETIKRIDFLEQKSVLCCDDPEIDGGLF